MNEGLKAHWHNRPLSAIISSRKVVLCHCLGTMAKLVKGQIHHQKDLGSK